MKKHGLLIIGAVLAVLTCEAYAEDAKYSINAYNGQFVPAALEVPANHKIKLDITNQDSEEVEFESFKLNREEKIHPGANKVVYVGPLTPGTYEYFDDLNPDAKGVLIVK